VLAAGGWPDAIGEDIVLTWQLMRQGARVYYEPSAVAFTVAPARLVHFARQRARWARGMIEGLRSVKPRSQPGWLLRFLTGIDLLIPTLDVAYSLVWLPGLLLAATGRFWIVGPYTVAVLPLTLLVNAILYRYQRRRVFNLLGLRVRRNTLGFVAFVLTYQILMDQHAVAVWSMAGACPAGLVIAPGSAAPWRGVHATACGARGCRRPRRIPRRPLSFRRHRPGSSVLHSLRSLHAMRRPSLARGRAICRRGGRRSWARPLRRLTMNRPRAMATTSVMASWTRTETVAPSMSMTAVQAARRQVERTGYGEDGGAGWQRPDSVGDVLLAVERSAALNREALVLAGGMVEPDEPLG
jgi:hypothetical protein